MSEQPPGSPRVEVWQQRDEAWRWRYVGVAEEEGEPLRLLSNESEPSEDEAVSAARLAYPGVPVHVLRGAPDEDAAQTAAMDAVTDPYVWAWRSATVALALTFLAATVRYRRWWAAPFAPLVAHRIVTSVRRRLP